MNIQKKKRTYRYIVIVTSVCAIASVTGGILYFSKDTPSTTKTLIYKKKISSEKNTPTKPKPSTFNAKLYSIDTPGSLWWIVNKNRPAGKEYLPSQLVTPNITLNTAKSSQENSLRPETAKALEKLFSDGQQSGYAYMLASGYRSYSLQATYYNNYVATSGQAEADRYSARPGTSEHQTGLSLDVSMANRVHYLDQAFGQDPAGKWLAEHAHNYGFIIRYPEGKDAVTGYMYEPWHIRYVGIELATELFTANKTMEEYFHH